MAVQSKQRMGGKVSTRKTAWEIGEAETFLWRSVVGSQLLAHRRARSAQGCWQLLTSVCQELAAQDPKLLHRSTPGH